MHTPTNRQGKSSMGRDMSFKMKDKPNVSRDTSDRLVPGKGNAFITTAGSGKMPIGDGRKMFNFGRGPMKGNQNGTNNKVMTFESQHEKHLTLAREVGNMYNNDPMNLNMNRNSNVKKGKPAKHDHNQYEERLVATL